MPIRSHLTLLLLASLLPVAVLRGEDGKSQATVEFESGPNAAQRTVERALQFLVDDTAKWRSTRKCATCHHGAMTVWALNEAKAHGYVISEDGLTEVTRWTKDLFVPQFSHPRDPRWGYNFFSLPGIYLSLMSQSLPVLSRDEIRKVALHLQRHQEENGIWLLPPPNPNGSPPSYESEETITLLALLAWDPYAPHDSTEARLNDAARDKALVWLQNAKPTETTQAAALRLLYAFRTARPAEQIQSCLAELLQKQDSAGGWSQTKDLSSDAYATGQVLWVLSHVGLTVEHPAIERATRFLVDTQKEDGAWPMTARSHPEKDTSKDRYMIPINYFGAAWGTIGLVRYTPPYLDLTTRRQRAINWIQTFSGRIETDSSTDANVTTVKILYELNEEQIVRLAAHLTAFSQLKTLEIKSPKLTDASAAQLKQLSQLRSLSLENTSLTDAGLAHLKSMAQLDELNLKGTKVTDAGVENLSRERPEIKLTR